MLPEDKLSSSILPKTGGLNITDYLPSDALRPFIRSYKIIESYTEQINKVLPSSGVAIAFRYRGLINYIDGTTISPLSAFTVTGLRKTVRFINYKPLTSAIIVLFRETGASAFFRSPLHELFEESVSLDHLIPHTRLSILEEQLASASGDPKRIAILEKFLLQVWSHLQPDLLLLKAVEIIKVTGGNIRIKTLSGNLHISQDAFEKRFRKAIGTSPKQYASIVRIQSLVSQIKNHNRFSDLALDAGFYDQAHFNNDFKLFTGHTPTEFSRISSFW